MADRFPLILNTSINQIQEIASGDQLDLTGNNIANAGIITATSFSGPVVAGAGVSNITAGIGTYTDLRVGGNTTFSEDLVVTGNARVTGILTVGTSSIILNDSTNTIKVGTALTLGHTQGLQFHTQNLHSAGFEVNQINASGIITATDADINGELDVDGPTHLDYVSISGVTTHSDTVHIIDDKVLMFGSGGDSTIEYDENGTDQLTIAGAITRFTNTTQSTSKDTGSVIFEGGLGVEKNLSVGGNVSVGGVLTYEDVTNVDSVGIVTAREGIFIPDNKELKIGNTAASSDLRIYSNGTESYVDSYGGNFYIRVTDQAGGVENKLVARPNAQTELYYNDAKKLQTDNTGITVTGTVNATTFVGALTGNATSSDTVDITNSSSSGTTFFLTFVDNNGSGKILNLDSGLSYVPSSNILTAGTFSGSGANLTNLPAANITGTLPAISGANLTGVLKNIVEDTSPQLGADLDCNQKGILLQDRNSGNQGAIKWGDNGEMWMFHSGSDNTNRIYSSGKEWAIWSGASNDHACIKVTASDTDPAVVLYWNGAAKLYTNANGVNVDKCLQAGSVQSPIESSISHHQSHDPAAIFYPEGGYGNNNSPSNQRQAVIIGSTLGNWVDGHSGNTRGVGIKFSRIVNSAEQVRAGIQHDINSTEKFKFHTSYGDIHFRTRNGNNGNQTWEECDRDPLVMHHNGHVSMCHMPRTYWNVQQSSSSYSSNTTEYTYTGGSASDSNGMVTDTGAGTITVPYTGVYQICMNIGLHSNSSTNQRLNLKINGNNKQRTESTEVGWCTHTISHCILLSANDAISFTCVGRTDGGDYSNVSVVMMHGTLTT